jgi:CRP-like cAMP-binding protein
VNHPDAAGLSRVPLFEGLSDAELVRLATWLEVEQFQAGASLTREGRSDYAFFVLAEGTVRVEHDATTVATLGPGDVLGELAILGDGRRKADAVAETEVVVLSMFGTRFREMQLSMPIVAERLDAIAAQRRRDLDATA